MDTNNRPKPLYDYSVEVTVGRGKSIGLQKKTGRKILVNKGNTSIWMKKNGKK
jgi:hypothetical protein